MYKEERESVKPRIDGGYVARGFYASRTDGKDRRMSQVTNGGKKQDALQSFWPANRFTGIGAGLGRGKFRHALGAWRRAE
jgi:hypothetical protein